MTKRKRERRQQERLCRIERKCDRMLSELLVLRQRVSAWPSLDSAIDQLHLAARNMRCESERERDAARGLVP